MTTPNLTKPPVTPPADSAVDKVKLASAEFRVFKCSRPSVRLITPKGFRITFTGYKYATQNPEAVEYLEQCVKDRVPGITDAGKATAKSLNPEATMRENLLKEFMDIQAKAKAEGRDFGVSDMKKFINPLTTKGTAS